MGDAIDELADFVLVRVRSAKGSVPVSILRKSISRAKSEGMREYVRKTFNNDINKLVQSLSGVCVRGENVELEAAQKASSNEKDLLLKDIALEVSKAPNKTAGISTLGQIFKKSRRARAGVGALKNFISKQGGAYGLRVEGELVMLGGDSVALGPSARQKKRLEDAMLRIVRKRPRELHALCRDLIAEGFMEADATTVSDVVRRRKKVFAMKGRLVSTQQQQVEQAKKKTVTKSSSSNNSKLVKFVDIPSSLHQSEEERRLQFLSVASSVGRVRAWKWENSICTVQYDHRFVPSVEEIFEKTPPALVMGRSKLRYSLVPNSGIFRDTCDEVDPSVYEPRDDDLLIPFIDARTHTCTVAAADLSPPIGKPSSDMNRASAVVLVQGITSLNANENLVLQAFREVAPTHMESPFGATVVNDAQILAYAFFKDWASAHEAVKRLKCVGTDNRLRVGFARAQPDARPAVYATDDDWLSLKEQDTFADKLKTPRPVFRAPTAPEEERALVEEDARLVTSQPPTEPWVEPLHRLAQIEASRIANAESDAFLLEQERLVADKRLADAAAEECEMALHLPSDLWQSANDFQEDDAERFRHAAASLLGADTPPAVEQRKKPASWAAKAANEAGPKLVSLKTSFGVVAAVDELVEAPTAPVARSWGSPTGGAISSPAASAEFPTLGAEPPPAIPTRPPPSIARRGVIAQAPPTSNPQPMRGAFAIPTRGGSTARFRNELRPADDASHRREEASAGVKVIILQTGDELSMVLDSYTRGSDIKRMLLQRSNVRAALPVVASASKDDLRWLALIARDREVRDDDFLLRCGVEDGQVLHVAIRD